LSYVEGKERRQAILFPDHLDDYVSEENPVRFMDAFVEEQDLVELGFDRAEPKEMGRPSYHPGLLLRLYIYGYVNNIRSSRKLEREARRNMELMWLMEMLTPDYRTIADFRKDNLEPIKKMCQEFTRLCKKMDMFGGELVGVDGSKFKADNSTERNYTKKKLEKLIDRADQRIAKYLAELDKADQEEDETAETKPVSAEELKERIEQLKKGREKHKQRQKNLEESGEKQVSETDPDSRLMKTREGSAVCYNVQVAVDNKHKLIAAHEVTNAGSDRGQLANIAKQAKETMGVENLEATTDMGYYDCEDVKQCEEEGITVYMQKPPLGEMKKKGMFSKEDFSYKAEKDVYVCPAGQELNNRGKGIEKGRQMKYYATAACGSCVMKKQCTEGAQRRIKRLVNEEVMERMAARVRAGPDKLRIRRALVEHPFGTIKRAMGQGYFLMRGKSKVGTEMSMTVMAYNMKRVINIAGVKKMIEALG
jgi:transposase